MKNGVVLIGGGEHARVVAETIRRGSIWKVDGYVAPTRNPRTEAIPGMRHLGDDLTLTRSFQEVSAKARPRLHLAFAAADLGDRRVVASRLAPLEPLWITVIDRTAVVSPSAVIGEGVFVGAHAVVNAGSQVRDHAIINTGAIVEHDVEVGAFTHIAPGVVIGGGASIGEEAFIGIAAVVRDHVRIGDRCTVGMGAAVIDDVPSGLTVVGVPAHEMTR